MSDPDTGGHLGKRPSQSGMEQNRPGRTLKAASVLLLPLTGGRSYEGRFLRGLIWIHRRRFLLVMAISAAAAILEGATMGSMALTLEPMTGEVGSIDVSRLGWFGSLVLWFRDSLSLDGYFLAMVGITVLSQFLRCGATLLGKLLAVGLGTRIAADLKIGITHQLLCVSYREVSRYKTGDLALYMQHAQSASSMVDVLCTQLLLVFTLLGYAAIMLLFSWQMTLAVVVMLFFIAGITRYGFRRIKEYSKQNVIAVKRTNESVVEFMSGVRHIHTYGRERYVEAHIGRWIRDGMHSLRRSQSWLGSVPPTLQALLTLGVGVFLVTGYFLMLKGSDASVAKLLGFIAILYRIMPSVTRLNQGHATIVNLWPKLERVATLLRREGKEFLTRGRLPFRELRSEIVLDGVDLSYEPSGKGVLDGLTFTIRRGDTTALVGASGSGKTSTVNLLLRLYDPTGGDILIDGTPLRDLKIEDWRSYIGLVDQEPFIFNDTIRENIRFGRLDASDEEVFEAARAAAANGFIEGMPEGYETIIGERGAGLSGGQKQRIVIARALLRNPGFLILDEATSSLDSETESAVLKAVEKVRGDLTVLAIAHRLSTIRMADHIVVIDRGRVVEEGRHEVLLEGQGVYWSLWEAQQRD